MTGMKEGAGENPFAEDAEPAESADPVEDRPDDPQTTTEAETDRTRSERRGTGQSSGQQPMQIPYKFRRDGVQDSRDRVPLFLQADTKSAERDALRELEERFDEDVALTDLREALVKAGLRNLDAVEDHLESWGYGMTFDE